MTKKCIVCEKTSTKEAKVWLGKETDSNFIDLDKTLSICDSCAKESVPFLILDNLNG